MAKDRPMTAVQEFRSLVEAVRNTHQSVAMDLRVQFACLVTQLLRDKGWTQSNLAEAADKAPESSISEIVHADANCTFETIGKILFALGVRGKLEVVSPDVPATTGLDLRDTTARGHTVPTITCPIESKTDGQENNWFDDIQETGEKAVQEDHIIVAA